MIFDRRFRAALAALLLTFMSTFSLAVVDRAVCSASDSGGTSCTVSQLKSAINEEVNAVDTRAPMVLGSVSGTNTITASVTPTLTAYADGQSFRLKPANNTTSTVTLNINSIGAKALVSINGSALSTGDLLAASLYTVSYYAASDHFRVMTPLGAGGTATGSAGGDLTGTYPNPTVASNAVALGTDTTGNYMSDITAGAGIAVTHTPAEGSTGTLAFNYSDQGASPSLAADACQFTSNATTGGFIVCEGDTADGFETRITVTDPTADRLMTIPNADSSAVQPLTCSGTDKVSAISALGVVTCTADSGAAGGDSITVNTTAVVDPDFDSATPAAAAGGVNVIFQTASNDVSAYVPLGTTSGPGSLELATTAEAAAQSSTSLAITPQGLAFKPESICVAASDETTSITTGTAKTTFHVPYAFTLTAVSASVNTAPTGSTIIIDINEDPDAEGGTASATILSTRLTIDASERRSSTAAAAAVISDTALGANAEMTIDFDQVGSSTPGKGVKVCLIGHQ